jgi:hypothetical protein
MHEGALGNVDEIAAVDDFTRRLGNARTSLRRLRPLGIERGENCRLGARGIAIVPGAGFGERRMQFGDVALAQDAGDPSAPAGR